VSKRRKEQIKRGAVNDITRQLTKDISSFFKTKVTQINEVTIIKSELTNLRTKLSSLVGTIRSFIQTSKEP